MTNRPITVTSKDWLQSSSNFTLISMQDQNASSSAGTQTGDETPETQIQTDAVQTDND